MQSLKMVVLMIVAMSLANANASEVDQDKQNKKPMSIDIEKGEVGTADLSKGFAKMGKDGLSEPVVIVQKFKKSTKGTIGKVTDWKYSNDSGKPKATNKSKGVLKGIYFLGLCIFVIMFIMAIAYMSYTEDIDNQKESLEKRNEFNLAVFKLREASKQKNLTIEEI